LVRSYVITIAEKRKQFRELHGKGCFAIPNPWDIGSARYLQSLGFKAIATTSAGFAFSRGLPDGSVPVDAMLGHFREIVEASDLPVNADFEHGYAHEPNRVAENVRLCLETGVAGLSIEDSTGEKERPLYDLDQAVARIKAARTAIDQSGQDVVLVGRAECFLVGQPDIAEVIRRLKAYSMAGADCLYAPGVGKREEIATLVAEVAPNPLNVLVGAPSDLTMTDLAAMGVRRVSVGGALTRAAWGGFMRAARDLAHHGRFDGFAGATPHGELNQFMNEDMRRRGIVP